MSIEAVSESKVEPSPTAPPPPANEPAMSAESPVQPVETEAVLEPTTSQLSLDERIEISKKKLEEKNRAKAIKEFQDAHENEIKRRNLGKNMSEFKVSC